MIRALVIGCGNIGAMYDFDNTLIKTHCKALSELTDAEVSVYDADEKRSEKIAANYSFTQLKNEPDVTDFDWVAIASPTDTHLYWLTKCFAANTPLIICEKPLVNNEADLPAIERLYAESNSKVMVNYFRRFQPEYESLKKNIEGSSKPVEIIIRYQRGIINNFSHAADLLNFLFGGADFENVHISGKSFDEFSNDPTVSFTASYNDIPCTVTGLQHVKYSYFEIELFFADKKIGIYESGNRIIYEAAQPYERFYQPLKQQKTATDILDNAMRHVYVSAKQIFEKQIPDNFAAAVQMNRAVIKIIQQ